LILLFWQQKGPQPTTRQISLDAKSSSMVCPHPEELWKLKELFPAYCTPTWPWPFDPKMWRTHLSPILNRWCQFAENVSNTLQDTMLTFRDTYTWTQGQTEQKQHASGHLTLGGGMKNVLQQSLYSYSYRVTLFNKLFSEESCSVIGLSEKMGFQLWSELSATVKQWAEVRWKCVPDDRSRDGETSLADGRVCPQNEQVTAISRTEWPTWQIRDWADDLLEVDRTSTLDTVEGL